ncbi:MAG: three-Cys-motif partner protein TcmP [Candidatus Coatesbacteria bacterium]|nr:three-Cys-motif partner protein TcmP [Candidatus Coatesbacteria bacterium]
MGSRNDVVFKEGDCNCHLREIFPKISYNAKQRALCILDSYGLHIKWDVIKLAGKQKSIELFIHFPVMDIQRNALWANPDRLPEDKIERMNRAWGDSSWLDVSYDNSQLTFNGEKHKVKKKTEAILNEFRNRLINIADYFCTKAEANENKTWFNYLLFILCFAG